MLSDGAARSTTAPRRSRALLRETSLGANDFGTRPDEAHKQGRQIGSLHVIGVRLRCRESVRGLVSDRGTERLIADSANIVVLGDNVENLRSSLNDLRAGRTTLSESSSVFLLPKCLYFPGSLHALFNLLEETCDHTPEWKRFEPHLRAIVNFLSSRDLRERFVKECMVQCARHEKASLGLKVASWLMLCFADFKIGLAITRLVFMTSATSASVCASCASSPWAASCAHRRCARQMCPLLCGRQGTTLGNCVAPIDAPVVLACLARRSCGSGARMCRRVAANLFVFDGLALGLPADLSCSCC